MGGTGEMKPTTTSKPSYIRISGTVVHHLTEVGMEGINLQGDEIGGVRLQILGNVHPLPMGVFHNLHDLTIDP